jgi:hypothetical protein
MGVIFDLILSGVYVLVGLIWAYFSLNSIILFFKTIISLFRMLFKKSHNLKENFIGFVIFCILANVVKYICRWIDIEGDVAFYVLSGMVILFISFVYKEVKNLFTKKTDEVEETNNELNEEVS